jgi:hypothetical protein
MLTMMLTLLPESRNREPLDDNEINDDRRDSSCYQYESSNTIDGMLVYPIYSCGSIVTHFTVCNVEMLTCLNTADLCTKLYYVLRKCIFYGNSLVLEVYPWLNHVVDKWNEKKINAHTLIPIIFIKSESNLSIKTDNILQKKASLENLSNYSYEPLQQFWKASFIPCTNCLLNGKKKCIVAFRY